MNKPSYWEKTVEYAFVIRASESKKLDFVAPLSGKEERGAGDAIFGKDAALILVEFKIDETQLQSEEELFYDYKQAVIDMSGCDAHHFLIFADKAPVEGKTLPPLSARTYFSSKPIPSPMDCFNHGVSGSVFKDYIAKLLGLKKPDGRSGSGQIGVDALANVIGVRAGSNEVSTVTLSEYVKFMFPELTPEPPIAPTHFQP